MSTNTIAQKSEGARIPPEVSSQESAVMIPSTQAYLNRNTAKVFVHIPAINSRFSEEFEPKYCKVELFGTVRNLLKVNRVAILRGILELDEAICILLPVDVPSLDPKVLVACALSLGYGGPVWKGENLSKGTALSWLEASEITTQPQPVQINSIADGISKQAHNWTHMQQRVGSSPMDFFTPKSKSSTPGSFVSTKNMACSRSPIAQHNTARTPYMIPNIPEESVAVGLSGPLAKLGLEYQAKLQDKDLIQPSDKELNWSGKGQHVIFYPREKVPLEFLAHLGASVSARVEKVLCRRIALARKTMRCTRNWTITDALCEVHHLQNLRHFHITQLVGTYLQGRDFSILMYPAADSHLGVFLEDTADMSDDSLTENEYRCRKLFLGSTFSCLASAIAFIHTKTTRHMDIKPHNILVRKTCEPSKDDKPGAYWRIYLSDFGLSRCFATNDHSQTDGPTSRTPKYCAPEVFMYESRGRSSDIFSLGCVYAEILTTYAGHHPSSFSDYLRNDDGDESFHLNISKVGAWFDLISVGWVRIQVVATIIKKMLSVDSQFRPTAAEVAASIPLCTWLPVCSCVQQPEPYVAYSEPSPPISDICKDPLPRVKSSEQRG